MLSKNKIKLIKSLEIKKYREKENLFIIEGDKLSGELLKSGKYKIAALFATDEWINKNENLKPFFPKETIIISENELKKISLLVAPQEVLCLSEIPKSNINPINFNNKLILVLDRIQDPGNLGTIIRVADWFGIDDIICSEDTVDVYNPKVIQSTMGAIFRVNVTYRNLISFLESVKSFKIQVYGTSLDGKNIYNTPLTENGIIIMGNESKGIDKSLLPFITKKILIPYYPQGEKRSESLNVSMSTAIICAEFRRRKIV